MLQPVSQSNNQCVCMSLPSKAGFLSQLHERELEPGGVGQHGSVGPDVGVKGVVDHTGRQPGRLSKPFKGRGGGKRRDLCAIDLICARLISSDQPITRH